MAVIKFIKMYEINDLLKDDFIIYGKGKIKNFYFSNFNENEKYYKFQNNIIINVMDLNSKRLVINFENKNYLFTTKKFYSKELLTVYERINRIRRLLLFK